MNTHRSCYRIAILPMLFFALCTGAYSMDDEITGHDAGIMRLTVPSATPLRQGLGVIVLSTSQQSIYPSTMNLMAGFEMRYGLLYGATAEISGRIIPMASGNRVFMDLGGRWAVYSQGNFTISMRGIIASDTENQDYDLVQSLFGISSSSVSLDFSYPLYTFDPVAGYATPFSGMDMADLAVHVSMGKTGSACVELCGLGSSPALNLGLYMKTGGMIAGISRSRFTGPTILRYLGNSPAQEDVWALDLRYIF